MASNTESTLEDAPSLVGKMLPPPRKGTVTPQPAPDDTDDQQRDLYQLRRIIKRRCNLEGLRKILEQPPKLTEINESIIAAADDDDKSVCSTISKALRRHKQKRQKGNGQFSNLSKEQRKFMKQQQLKAEKRRLKEEKVREQMGNAILAGGMGGAEGMDLSSVQSLSLEDAVPASQMSESTGSNGSSCLPHSEAYEAQKAIQEKIEIADMGLAILMAEAQRLERMMSAMHEKERLERDLDAGEDESRQGKRQSSNLESDDTDTDREDGREDSSLDSRDSEARKAALIAQGCEVEYSFPHQYHDVLEAALMGEDVEDAESDSSYDSDEDSTRVSVASKPGRRRRGRSPPKMGGSRKEEVYPIVAIPTNGEGCVVLRESGAFDVIGKIPDVLLKKLFRPNGPLPDQIALGTMGRYYVHFTDGSFYFYGPPSLNKVLTKAKKNRKGKHGNRGKQDVNSIASVAFGKQLDDWFVVRSDGSWESNGDIPSGLDELMKNRKGRGDLLWVALGVDNEWCVSARNGRVWWEGVTEEADEVLADILAEGENELNYIDFGADGTYFVLHK